MSVFRNLIIADVMKVKYDGLCFTAVDANSTVAYTLNGGLTGKGIKTSTDGTTWSAWDGTAITLTNAGDKLYVKGNNASGLSTSGTTYLQFAMTGKISGSGNTNSLLDDGDGSTITTIPNDCCYYSLFYNCSSLTTAPRLPATTLANDCYRYMFYGCSSLTTAPALPATNLTGASDCYSHLFERCSSLTTAPALPATTLSNYCYSYMFQRCSSLTTAPDLPATTLANGCYVYMFENCTALTQIKIGYTGNFSTSYMYSWVNGVNSVGVLYYNGTDTTVGASAIPTNFVKTAF